MDDWVKFPRMPRRLRRLRFISRKLHPVIHRFPLRPRLQRLESAGLSGNDSMLRQVMFTVARDEIPQCLRRG